MGKALSLSFSVFFFRWVCERRGGRKTFRISGAFRKRESRARAVRDFSAAGIGTEKPRGKEDCREESRRKVDCRSRSGTKFLRKSLDKKRYPAIIKLLARRADHSLEMIGRIRQQTETSVTYPAFFVWLFRRGRQSKSHRRICGRSRKIEKDVGCARGCRTIRAPFFV